MITTHLRSRATLDGVPGLKRSAVVDWYLQKHADEVGEETRAHAAPQAVLKRARERTVVVVVAHEDNEPVLAVHRTSTWRAVRRAWQDGIAYQACACRRLTPSPQSGVQLEASHRRDSPRVAAQRVALEVGAQTNDVVDPERRVI